MTVFLCLINNSYLLCHFPCRLPFSLSLQLILKLFLIDLPHITTTIRYVSRDVGHIASPKHSITSTSLGEQYFRIPSPVLARTTASQLRLNLVPLNKGLKVNLNLSQALSFHILGTGISFFHIGSYKLETSLSYLTVSVEKQCSLKPVSAQEWHWENQQQGSLTTPGSAAMNAQLTMIFLSPFSSVNRFCYSHPVALRKFAALFSVIQN